MMGLGALVGSAGGPYGTAAGGGLGLAAYKVLGSPTTAFTTARNISSAGGATQKVGGALGSKGAGYINRALSNYLFRSEQ